jgi:hypothetical protein
VLGATDRLTTALDLGTREAPVSIGTWLTRKKPPLPSTG